MLVKIVRIKQIYFLFIVSVQWGSDTVNTTGAVSVSSLVWRDPSVITELELIFGDVGGKVEMNSSELLKYHSATAFPIL